MLIAICSQLTYLYQNMNSSSPLSWLTSTKAWMVLLPSANLPLPKHVQFFCFQPTYLCQSMSDSSLSHVTTAKAWMILLLFQLTYPGRSMNGSFILLVQPTYLCQSVSDSSPLSQLTTAKAWMILLLFQLTYPGWSMNGSFILLVQLTYPGQNMNGSSTFSANLPQLKHEWFCSTILANIQLLFQPLFLREITL